MSRLSLVEKIIFVLILISSFILNTVEGFSRLSIFLAILFHCFLFIKINKIFFFREFFLPFAFLVFNVFSLFWGGNIDYVFQVSSAIIVGYTVYSGLKCGMPVVFLLWGLVIAAILNIVFSSESIVYFQVVEKSRIAGLIGNANALAILLSFVAFSVYFLVPQRHLLKNSFVFFLLFFVFFYTGSRKGLLLVGMISFFIGIDYLMWQRVKTYSQRFMIIILSLIIALGFCAKRLSDISNDVMSVQRAEALLRGEDRWSAQTRYSMIGEGIELWLERPIFGWGGGGFSIKSGFRTYSHNNYVELLSNYGFIGLCLYYIFYFKLFLLGWQSRKDYFVRVGLWMVIMLFVLELGSVSLGDKTSWIFLGIATYCIQSGQKRLTCRVDL